MIAHWGHRTWFRAFDSIYTFENLKDGERSDNLSTLYKESKVRLRKIFFLKQRGFLSWNIRKATRFLYQNGVKEIG